MNELKVEINVIGENGEKYAEIKVNNEKALYSEFSHFSAMEIYQLLGKLGISVDYSDRSTSLSPFRLFPQYKEYVERLSSEDGKTVKEYLELNKNSRIYKMIEEVIDTEVKEQCAYEQGLNAVPLHNLFDPAWYYTVTLDDPINEQRYKELYELIAPRIKTELGLM